MVEGDANILLLLNVRSAHLVTAVQGKEGRVKAEQQMGRGGRVMSPSPAWESGGLLERRDTGQRGEESLFPDQEELKTKDNNHDVLSEPLKQNSLLNSS